MTIPTRLNPFRALTRINSFSDFDDLLRDFGRRSFAHEYEKAMDMRLDINEDDQAYIVNIDMPGIKKQDIDISIDGSQVTVRAEVNRELSQGSGKEIYSERYSGQGYRSFALPTEVDSAIAHASYDGGVLTLTLPKKTESKAKHLPIN